jgi:hypothetical protein
MTTRTLTSMFGVCLIAAALGGAPGCNKEESPFDGAGKSASKGAAETGAAASEAGRPGKVADFAGYDLGELERALQGNWVFHAGIYQFAWSAEGKRARVYERGEEKKVELEVLAPCFVSAMERTAGGSSGTVYKMVAAGDDLVFGPAALGFRSGDTVYVCSSNEVYTYRDGECRMWKKSMFDSKYEPGPGTCGPSEESESLFTITDATDYTSTLAWQGDLLGTQHARIQRATRAATFEEARAALESD